MENKISRIQFRQDTTLNWVNSTSVPSLGEPLFATDTGVFKIGNGVDVWENLPIIVTTNPISDVPNDGFKYLRKFNEWVKNDEALDLKDLLRSTANNELDMNYQLDGNEVYGKRLYVDNIITSNPGQLNISVIANNVNKIIDFGGSFQLGTDEWLSIGNNCSLGNSYLYIDTSKNLDLVTVDERSDRNNNIIDMWVLYTKIKEDEQ